jgi:CRISPR/Cas system CMR subunit Cmr4 (Cas7 group RAMP superfamily)
LKTQFRLHRKNASSGKAAVTRSLQDELFQVMAAANQGTESTENAKKTDTPIRADHAFPKIHAEADRGRIQGFLPAILAFLLITLSQEELDQKSSIQRATSVQGNPEREGAPGFAKLIPVLGIEIPVRVEKGVFQWLNSQPWAIQLQIHALFPALALHQGEILPQTP